MPSPMLKSNQNNCKQNSPRIVVSWRHPLFWTSHGLMFVGGREYKLYHSVWEPPIMCLVWKILGTLGRYVDNESIPLKIIFISVLASSSGTSTSMRWLYLPYYMHYRQFPRRMVKVYTLPTTNKHQSMACSKQRVPPTIHNARGVLFAIII